MTFQESYHYELELDVSVFSMAFCSLFSRLFFSTER